MDVVSTDTIAAGAVVGGVFAGLWSLLWWPWTFWTFGIAMFAVCGLSILILPSVPLDPRVQRMTLKEKVIQLDLLGGSVGVSRLGRWMRSNVKLTIPS